MSIELIQAAQQSATCLPKDVVIGHVNRLIDHANHLNSDVDRLVALQSQVTLLTNMLESAQKEAQSLQKEVDRLTQLSTSEPAAALVRYRRLRTPAHCAFDKKDHYSEWSDWVPCTLSYAKAVTDPNRDAGLLPLYEMLPLYTHPAPGVSEGYALVPIEPTAEMLQAALKVATPGALRAAWARMLAAAEIGKAMS